MSRVGKMPIAIPQGVNIELGVDAVVVTGPKGRLQERRIPEIECIIENQFCVVQVKSQEKRARQLHGLYRQLINNMVVGVTQGFSKTLNLVGVGYRAEAKGKSVIFSLGYSTAFEYVPPEGITVQTPKQDVVIVEGISKQKVGQVSAEIRQLRKPEPYKGKGIKYSDELIRRKEGKSGKK